jgi:predicted ArsR family transcriptional regulator
MSRLEAIADPVRLKLVRHLSAGPGASLEELAEAAAVHPNTVRAHIVALEAAGIVERESATPTGRGRPRVGYRLARDWSPPTADYRGLAELLAAVLLRSGHEPADLRAVGLEWGRYLHGRPGAHDMQSDLPPALERLGFDARVEGCVLELASCPCSAVLPDNPELVCGLAAAVADGVLAGSGSELRVGERSHDPAARRCSLALEPALS